MQLLGKATSQGNLLEEIGNPVVAEILLNGARRAGGGTSFLEVHGEIETIPTHNGVHMARDCVGVHDGIRALKTDRIVARQTPKGRYLWEEA